MRAVPHPPKLAVREVAADRAEPATARVVVMLARRSAHQARFKLFDRSLRIGELRYTFFLCNVEPYRDEPSLMLSRNG